MQKEEILELRIKKNEINMVTAMLMILALTGGFLNIMAVSLNNGRMPVLYEHENYTIDTKIHFSYTQDEKQDINKWYITDIIPLGNKMIMSIGDLLIFLAIPFLIFNVIRNIKISRKIRKMKK